YKAIDKDKHIIEGVISAKTKKEAADHLGNQSLTPLIIKEVREKFLIGGTIPEVDKITFCRYIHIMLATGLSISEGIDVLKRETKHPLMKRILSDMQYGLEQGQSLSAIFERYPSVFESYFITLMKAGEASGKLAEVFEYLEIQLRSEYNLKSKVKGALLYPAIVFLAMIGIGILMFFFILPQIGKVFLSLSLPLPFMTKFMFQLSIVLSGYIIPIAFGVFGGIVVFFFAIKTKTFKDTVIGILGQIPLIKKLIKKVDLARFCRIFSTLIRSAVPITDALEISFSLLTWKQYRSLSPHICDEIRKGKALAVVMKETNIFPSLFVQMVAAGEKTATLDETLGDLAVFYEQEVEEEVKGLTQIIEPVMMLCVGVAVGVMILSIIAPIYSVVGNFQQTMQGRR
ncbi:MAG: type II secretion system F family protein, partial [Patescibacteria group bacterium]|nr:type II secretion system F family protein [Patescibacteria group bacterium]